MLRPSPSATTSELTFVELNLKLNLKQEIQETGCRLVGFITITGVSRLEWMVSYGASFEKKKSWHRVTGMKNFTWQSFQTKGDSIIASCQRSAFITLGGGGSKAISVQSTEYRLDLLRIAEILRHRDR